MYNVIGWQLHEQFLEKWFIQKNLYVQNARSPLLWLLTMNCNVLYKVSDNHQNPCFKLLLSWPYVVFG